MTTSASTRLFSGLSKPSVTRSSLFAVTILLISGVAAMAQYGPDNNDHRDRGRDYDQRDERSQYDRADTGVSAGGKWMSYQVEDPMTAAKKVRFELRADNTRDNDEQARVIFYCTNGKLDLADFHPNVPLSRPNWPGFWGQPQMRVLVRVNDSHDHHNWNWINGRFLAMDKGTARELIGAHLFRVEYMTPDGPRIAEFSPAGIDREQVSHACGLTPKRP